MLQVHYNPPISFKIWTKYTITVRKWSRICFKKLKKRAFYA